MPFSYRRSKRLGPLRLTASKRGVGVSVGGKRARVSRSATGRTSLSVAILRGLRWFKRL